MWSIASKKWITIDTLVQTSNNKLRMFWDLYINGKHFEIHTTRTDYVSYAINLFDYSVDCTQEVGCPVFDH